MDNETQKNFFEDLELDNGKVVLNIKQIKEINVDDEKINCFVNNSCSYNKLFDFYDVTNTIVELGKRFYKRLKISKSNMFNVYHIREDIILNKGNIADNFSKDIVEFIKNNYIPYNITSSNFSILYFVIDCIFIYKILDIKKKVLEIQLQNKEYLKDDDISLKDRINYCKQDFPQKVKLINHAYTVINDILEFMLRKEEYINTDKTKEYSNMQKNRLFSAMKDVRPITIEDIITNTNNFQNLNKLLAISINMYSEFDEIGSITINNLTYSCSKNKFLSYMCSDSIMAIAYYGVTMLLIANSNYNMEICSNPDCYNLFEKKGNTQQCRICLDKNNGRNTKNSKKKL